MGHDRIKELEEKIKKARNDYYNLSPSLSDQEYDALVDELKRLDPSNPEVTAIGAPPLYTIWKKIEHKIPMGSLNKVNKAHEFINWVQTSGIHQYVSNSTKDYLLITYKIDGSSLEVVYEDGKLIRTVTRGNGKVGEDITTNAIQIPNLPHIIPIKEEVIVRGEIVMFKSIFGQHYSEQYANPRNTAAGKIRDKKTGGKDCKDLSFLAFALISLTAPDSEDKRLKALKTMGFDTPEWTTGNMDGVISAHEMINKDRDNIPYEIDGTVIRINNIHYQEEMGELNMRPRGQIAWKFDPAMGVTKVIDVRWQTGTSSGGRITPVAQIEPIQIGGVVISNVSLHNLKIFKDLKLWRGCEVLVSRRNDVIPYIERNLSLDHQNEEQIDSCSGTETSI